MNRVILAIFGILMFVSIGYAEVNIGINPIFMDQTLSGPRLLNSFTSRNTGVELNAGFFDNKISMRGYYLFPVKSTFSTSIIEDTKTGKQKPAELSTIFTATRFEVGIPYFNNGTLIEPFFMSSHTKLDTNTNSDGINIPDLLSNNTSGLGLFYGQRIVNRQAIYLKGSVTPKDKIFDGSYNVVFKNCSFGAGYTYREYENVKITGPLLFIQLTF